MKYAKQAGRAVQYASRTTGVNFEKILTWGAIGVVGYLALEVMGFLKSAKDTVTDFGGSIGRGLYDWFHPDTVGEKIMYTVRFPDGVFHSVPSLSVGNDGTFTNKGSPPFYVGDGKVYRIARNSTMFRNAAGVTTNLMAVPV